MHTFDFKVLAIVCVVLCVIWLVLLFSLSDPRIFKNIYLPADVNADMAEVEKQRGVVECYKNAQNLVVKYNSKLTNEAEIKRFLGV